MIVACGPIRAAAVESPNGTGARGGLVYAVAVSQPVQSWTVLRSHQDFQAVADALSLILSGLPLCPSNLLLGSPDLSAIVEARNELQQWLSAILMYPGARESPAVRNFLTFGANTIPPQYEGVAWTQFNTVLSPVPASAGVAANHHHPNSNSPTSPVTGNVDDMEMEDMFLADDEGAHSHEDHNDFDEDFIPAASIRHKPTDEAVTYEDEMDIMQLAGEVEMVDDIGLGSLAQSMGASHLGRSLQLQAQMKYPGGNGNNSSKPAVQGLNVGGAGTQPVAHGTQSSGGIGSAMEQAVSSGIAATADDTDNFGRKPLQSAPRLDSFKMIKVIGKGSFGTFALLCRCSNCCVSMLLHVLGNLTTTRRPYSYCRQSLSREGNQDKRNLRLEGTP